MAVTEVRVSIQVSKGRGIGVRIKPEVGVGAEVQVKIVPRSTKRTTTCRTSQNQKGIWMINTIINRSEVRVAARTRTVATIGTTRARTAGVRKEKGEEEGTERDTRRGQNIRVRVLSERGNEIGFFQPRIVSIYLRIPSVKPRARKRRRVFSLALA